MQLASYSRKFGSALVALALCASSTGAIAASTQHTGYQASIRPLVALSAIGSEASRAALCGASAVAAAGAAAAAQGAAPGCVLPVVDAAPPPPVVEAAPPPPFVEPVAPVATGGFGVSPLLLALVGVAAAYALYKILDQDDESFFDVSPG